VWCARVIVDGDGFEVTRECSTGALRRGVTGEIDYVHEEIQTYILPPLITPLVHPTTSPSIAAIGNLLRQWRNKLMSAAGETHGSAVPRPITATSDRPRFACRTLWRSRLRSWSGRRNEDDDVS
jgi:hypothetical protein